MPVAHRLILNAAFWKRWTAGGRAPHFNGFKSSFKRTGSWTFMGVGGRFRRELEKVSVCVRCHNGSAYTGSLADDNSNRLSMQQQRQKNSIWYFDKNVFHKLQGQVVKYRLLLLILYTKKHLFDLNQEPSDQRLCLLICQPSLLGSFLVDLCSPTKTFQVLGCGPFAFDATSTEPTQPPKFST